MTDKKLKTVDEIMESIRRLQYCGANTKNQRMFALRAAITYLHAAATRKQERPREAPWERARRSLDWPEVCDAYCLCGRDVICHASWDANDECCAECWSERLKLQVPVQRISDTPAEDEAWKDL